MRNGAVALAIVLVAGVGCREIVGVPGETDLRSLDAAPPLCQCSPLDQQGQEFVDACLAAYAALPDFGSDEDEDAFASKEDLLRSECGVCRDGDEAFVSGCFGKLLASDVPGSGTDGASCDVAPECSSYACCAPSARDALTGADTTERTCCQECLGCNDYITAGDDEGRLCAGSFEVARDFVQCLCAGKGERCPVLCAGSLCEVNPDCWSCLLEEAACDQQLLACQDDRGRPYEAP